ncbi:MULTISPECIES: hypothetical protein [Frankia]|uniref:hypothetical protein n=1 Tax=Frankia TaxID=1854 RepID=UPI0005D1115E|nr:MULTISPECIES: hypothetical protein [Frankia]
MTAGEAALNSRTRGDRDVTARTPAIARRGARDDDADELLANDLLATDHRWPSRRRRTAWTTFATRGDPGWPAHDSARRLTKVFDTASLVTAYPEERSRLIWQDHSFPPLLLRVM